MNFSLLSSSYRKVKCKTVSLLFVVTVIIIMRVLFWKYTNYFSFSPTAFSCPPYLFPFDMQPTNFLLLLSCCKVDIFIVQLTRLLIIIKYIVNIWDKQTQKFFNQHFSLQTNWFVLSAKIFCASINHIIFSEICTKIIWLRNRNYFKNRSYFHGKMITSAKYKNSNKIYSSPSFFTNELWTLKYWFTVLLLQQIHHLCYGYWMGGT